MIELPSRLWIIIVNYRTADLTVECLRSLEPQLSSVANPQVVVVDNNSGDGSVEKLSAAIEQQGWSSWATLMPLDKNGGFAFGNNASIRVALTAPQKSDYIMLLNPDTVALPGSIKALVDFMDERPEVGIAGSQLRNANDSVECSAHPFPSPLTELDGAARLGVLSRMLGINRVYSQPQDMAFQCDWVSGASMIIRRQVVEEIGLMDENYFLYFEEVDFCRRARQADWQCWHVPDSKVMHLEGVSTGIKAKAKRRAGYWYDSRRRYFVKFYGIAGLAMTDALWIIGRTSFLVRRALRIGARKETSDPQRFLLDLIGGDVRSMLTGALWHIPRAGKHSKPGNHR